MSGLHADEREALATLLAGTRRHSAHGTLIAGPEVGREWLLSLAQTVIESEWLADREAAARADAWDQGAQAMKVARLVQGESLPANPYRAALAQPTDTEARP